MSESSDAIEVQIDVLERGTFKLASVMDAVVTTRFLDAIQTSLGLSTTERLLSFTTRPYVSRTRVVSASPPSPFTMLSPAPPTLGSSFESISGADALSNEASDSLSQTMQFTIITIVCSVVGLFLVGCLTWRLSKRCVKPIPKRTSGQAKPIPRRASRQAETNPLVGFNEEAPMTSTDPQVRYASLRTMAFSRSKLYDEEELRESSTPCEDDETRKAFDDGHRHRLQAEIERRISQSRASFSPGFVQAASRKAAAIHSPSPSGGSRDSPEKQERRRRRRYLLGLPQKAGEEEEQPSVSTDGAAASAASETEEERLRRIAWIRHCIKQGDTQKAFDLGWDGKPIRASSPTEHLEDEALGSGASSASSGYAEPFDVIFNEGPLGLAIATRQGLVVVAKVESDEAANKGVRVGDVVSAVGGQTTEGLEDDAVAELVSASSRPLTVTFVTPTRKVALISAGPVPRGESRSAPQPMSDSHLVPIVEVEEEALSPTQFLCRLRRDSQGRFHVRFAQVEESNAPITISVLKQSEAILDDRGQIVDGDIVRRVDGRDVAGLDVDAVKVLVGSSGAPIVDLVLERRWRATTEAAAKDAEALLDAVDAEPTVVEKKAVRGGRLVGSLRYSASGSTLPPVGGEPPAYRASEMGRRPSPGSSPKRSPKTSAPSSPPLASCMLTSAQVEVADRSDGASSGAAVDVTPPPAPDMQTLVSSSSGSLRLAGPHAGDDADQTELILTAPFSTDNAQTHLQRAKEDANTTKLRL